MKKYLIIIFILLNFGTLVSPLSAQAATCDATTPGASFIPDGIGGGIYTCPNGVTTNSVTGQTTVPTTPTPTVATTPVTAGNLPYVPLEPIPGLTSSPDLTSPQSLPIIINAIFKILLSIGALMAVLMLTVGGIQYMVSGGPMEKNQGIKRAQAALWGIVLLAAAWLILYTINPKLLDFNLTPCPTGDVGCTVTAAPAVAPASTPANNTGTVQTIQAPDSNAAITAMQNDPTGVTQATAQTANNDFTTDQATCVNTYNGFVGAGDLPDMAGCSNASSFTTRQGTYNKCANIPIPALAGGNFACYYNQ